MPNSALYGSATYRVPQRVLDGVRAALAQHPTAEGSRRANTLLANPELSYSAAKRIKADLDAPGAARQSGYELAGGRAMLAWLNQSLSQDRKSVTRSKTTRTNSGMQNQFRQAYERRETGAITNLARRADDGGDGITRQPMNENQTPEMMCEAAPDFAADCQLLAAALIKAYPTLTFEKDADGALCIMCGGLKLKVTAADCEDC